MTPSTPDPNDLTVQAAVAKISTELGKFIDDIGDSAPTVEELTQNPSLQDLAHSMSEHVAGILMASHGTLTLGGEAGGAAPMAGHGSLSLGGSAGGGPAAGAAGQIELSGSIAEVHGTMNVVLEGVVAQITATVHPGQVTVDKHLAEPGPMVLWAMVYLGLQQYIADKLLHESVLSVSPNVLAAIWTALAYVIQQSWNNSSGQD